jgi:Ca-activated chloride channel family protein
LPNGLSSSVGKWRGDKPGQIEVTGRSGQGTFSKTIDVSSSVTRPEHAALPQLWARSRIARLSDFAFGRSDDESAREVTSLGLKYSLLTAHTSFIAVLEEVRNAGASASNVNQPQPLPDGVSDLAVGDQYGSGAEPGFWILVLTAGLVLAIAARRKVGVC